MLRLYLLFLIGFTFYLNKGLSAILFFKNMVTRAKKGGNQMWTSDDYLSFSRTSG